MEQMVDAMLAVKEQKSTIPGLYVDNYWSTTVTV